MSLVGLGTKQIFHDPEQLLGKRKASTELAGPPTKRRSLSPPADPPDISASTPKTLDQAPPTTSSDESSSPSRVLSADAPANPSTMAVVPLGTKHISYDPEQLLGKRKASTELAGPPTKRRSLSPPAILQTSRLQLLKPQIKLLQVRPVTNPSYLHASFRRTPLPTLHRRLHLIQETAVTLVMSPQVPASFLHWVIQSLQRCLRLVQRRIYTLLPLQPL